MAIDVATEFSAETEAGLRRVTVALSDPVTENGLAQDGNTGIDPGLKKEPLSTDNDAKG